MSNLQLQFPGNETQPEYFEYKGRFVVLAEAPPIPAWRRGYEQLRRKPKPRLSDEVPDFETSLKFKSKVWCDEIATQIKNAYDHLDPATALRTISGIWENIGRVSQLAEARCRLTLRRVAAPPMTDLPAYLQNEFRELAVSDAELAAAHPLAIDVAKKLICACLYNLSEAVTANVQKAPMGHVFINWNMSPSVLQWEILPSALGWPGVRVNAVSMNRSNVQPEIQSRIFHNAFDVIEHFRERVVQRSTDKDELPG